MKVDDAAMRKLSPLQKVEEFERRLRVAPIHEMMRAQQELDTVKVALFKDCIDQARREGVVD